MSYDHDERIATRGVLAEVFDEREKQMVKWGRQEIPMVLSFDEATINFQRAEHLREANRYKLMNDARAEVKADAWDSILLEELHEAFTESDPAKVRAEMVQTAAVCVAIIECIDRAAA